MRHEATPPIITTSPDVALAHTATSAIDVSGSLLPALSPLNTSGEGTPSTTDLDAATISDPHGAHASERIPPAGDIPGGPESAERPSARRHLGNLAIAAVTGLAMRKGFDAGVLDGAKDTLGSPATGVAETTVIAGTLAVTSLREYATKGLLKSVKNELSLVQRSADKHTEKTTETRHMVEDAALIKPPKLKELPQGKTRPPRHKPGAHRTWRQERKLLKAIRAGNKATKVALEKKSLEYFNSKPIPREVQEKDTNKRTGKSFTYTRKYADNDFGTAAHKAREDSEPRTWGERKHYKKALREHAHLNHEVHEIIEKGVQSTLGKDERRLDLRADIEDYLTKRSLPGLERRLRTIQNREDWQSRVYDATKRQVDAGKRKTGQAIVRGVKSTARGTKAYWESSQRDAQAELVRLNAKKAASRARRDYKS